MTVQRIDVSTPTARADAARARRRALYDLTTTAGRAEAAQSAISEIAAWWGPMRMMLDYSEERGEAVSGGDVNDLSFNLRVASATWEVEQWANRLVSQLTSETDWVKPPTDSAPVLLIAIATQRIGHWTADERTGLAFVLHARQLANEVRGAATPSGAHWKSLDEPCPFHTTEGEQCPGVLETLIIPGRHTFPDLTCTESRQCPEPHCSHWYSGACASDDECFGHSHVCESHVVPGDEFRELLMSTPSESLMQALRERAASQRVEVSA